jgi:anti-sigma factor RsiW
MTCQPELVTGYVDGALDAPARAEMEAHLAECDVCRAQAAEERAVRGRLLGLLHAPLPEQLEARVHKRLRAPRGMPLSRLLLPFAAAALLMLGWARGQRGIVAWEMARDHDHCFGKKELPAQVWAEDRESVMRWFEGRGTRMPVIPESTGGFHVVGARYCFFPDLTRSRHVYYRSEKGTLSLFVLSRQVGDATPARYIARGHVVQVVRLGDMTVGVVGEEAADVEAFARTFRTSRASAETALNAAASASVVDLAREP